MVRRDDGQDVEYRLTQAGEELRPVAEPLGAWGMRWVGELGDVDLDPKLLLWDLHRNVDPGLVPPGRTVVAFDFVDVPSKLAAGGWCSPRRPWTCVTSIPATRSRCRSPAASAGWSRSGVATSAGPRRCGPGP